MVTLQEVKEGVADIDDLMKLNALLDMRAASEQQASRKARQGDAG